MPSPPGQGLLFAPPQGELFGDVAVAEGAAFGDLAIRAGVPASFVQGVRDELNGTLDLVREASALPWEDASRAMLAEMRVRSMSRWLPDAEGAALLAAFEAELDRLYGAEAG